MTGPVNNSGASPLPFTTVISYDLVSVPSVESEEGAGFGHVADGACPGAYPCFSPPTLWAAVIVQGGSVKDVPIIINGGITVFYNPVAGGLNGGDYALKIISILEGLRDKGKIVINGGLNLIQTIPEKQLRIPDIINALNLVSAGQRQYVLVAGGDGTYAEVVTGVAKSSVAEDVVIVPLKGGIANDMARICGVPKNPKKIVKFLSSAIPHSLDIAEVSINSTPQRVYLVHAFAAGVSGELFYEMEKVRSGFISGPFKNLRYLPAMVSKIFDSKTFYAQVGTERFATGEVIVTAVTSLGGVTAIPLPEEGLKAHILPLDPDKDGVLRLTGSVPIGEGFLRRILYWMGGKKAAITGDLLRLDSNRQIPIPPGGELRVSFSDKNGLPAAGVRGVLNGDAVDGEIKDVTIKVLKDQKISVLAAPGSELDIRKGNLLQGAKVVDFMSGFSGRIIPLFVVGAWEYMQHRYPEDGKMMNGFFMGGFISADAAMGYLYGASPIIFEMPLVVPPFEMGRAGASYGADALSVQLGIPWLRHGSLGNIIVGIGGGAGATAAVVKVIGYDTWQMAVKHFGEGVVRYVGAGMDAVENAAVNMGRGALDLGKKHLVPAVSRAFAVIGSFASAASELCPLIFIIPPGLQDYLADSDIPSSS